MEINQNIELYLQNTLVTPAAIHTNLLHPWKNKKYPQRYAFIKLRQYGNDFFKEGKPPRMIALAGLRGTGKTTLLWQMAEELYQKHTKEIYFFNVNLLKTLGIPLITSLELFQEKILKQRFNTINRKVAFLFDEVHTDEQWSEVMKIVYDEAKWVFILTTGSSALHLQTTADLATRMLIEKIYPYKFTEFLFAKTYFDDYQYAHRNYKKTYTGIFTERGVAPALKEGLFFSESASSAYNSIMRCEENIAAYYTEISKYHKSAGRKNQNGLNAIINEYISYHNIPRLAFYQEKTNINELILELFRRVILEDVPGISSENYNPRHLERLLFALAASDNINTEKLSQSLGAGKADEIEFYIDTLAKAELLNVLFPFGGWHTKVTKMKKAFFMSPSLRRALLSLLYGENLPEQYRSKLQEDLVAMYLKRIIADSRLSFAMNGNVSPDFVIETRESPVLLEVGTGKTSGRQIYKSSIDARYGILLNATLDKPQLSENFILLPLKWFLML